VQPYYYLHSDWFIPFIWCNFRVYFYHDLLLISCTQVIMMAQVLMEIVFESLSSFQSSVQGTAHLLSKKSSELQSMAKFTIWGLLAFFLPPQLFGNYCFQFSCVQWGCRQSSNSHPLCNWWYWIHTEDGRWFRHRAGPLIIILNYSDGIMLNTFIDSVATLAWCEFLPAFSSRLFFQPLK